MNLAEQTDLGSLLKNRRQECGLTVDDVANRTRIRRTYLLALEENRFQDLPGDAYTLGFLRNYANALGLPSAKVLDLYRRQAGTAVTADEVKIPAESGFTPPPRRKKSRAIWPWVSVLVLVLGVFGLSALHKFLSRPEPLPPREPVAIIDTNPAPPPAAVAPPAGAEPVVPGTAESAGVAGEGGTTAAAAATLSTSPPTAGAPVAPSATTEAAPTASSQASVAAAEKSSPAPVEEGLVFEFSGNGLVRLESIGANQIEYIGDNRPPQNYELTASAVLNWKVRQSARINIVDPSSVRIWVDQRPLNFAGRGAIVLQRKPAVAGGLKPPERM